MCSYCGSVTTVVRLTLRLRTLLTEPVLWEIYAKENFFFRFVLLAIDKNSACEKDRLESLKNDLHFVGVS